jgi:hypothetical protein
LQALADAPGEVPPRPQREHPDTHQQYREQRHPVRRQKPAQLRPRLETAAADDRADAEQPAVVPGDEQEIAAERAAFGVSEEGAQRREPRRIRPRDHHCRASSRQRRLDGLDGGDVPGASDDLLRAAEVE